MNANHSDKAPWQLYRRAGKPTSRWRIVFRGEEMEAKDRYYRAFRSMKAGHIVLTAPDRLVCSYFRPATA